MLLGIAVEVVFSWAILYWPPVQDLLGTGPVPLSLHGEFWGFVSDIPFSSVKLIGGLGTNQQNYRLDDMVYAPVPEPATIGLFALCGLVLLLRSRLSS